MLVLCLDGSQALCEDVLVKSFIQGRANFAVRRQFQLSHWKVAPLFRDTSCSASTLPIQLRCVDARRDVQIPSVITILPSLMLV